MVVGWGIALLLFLAALGALVGMYKAHFLGGGMVFGTTSGSLSILAFSVTLTLWAKFMCHCCGCMGKGEKK